MPLNRSPQATSELATSIPRFPGQVGHTLTAATALDDVTRKQVIYHALDRPGAVHVYRADCPAGQRIRVQVLAPVLQNGRALAPAVALVAQGLRTGPAELSLPLPLPAGYAVVTVQPPAKLELPLTDRLTAARFFPGPLIDERILVGGRCYIVVWNPHKQPGKYLLQIGYARGQGRLAALLAWWRIRGWFGMSRLAGYLVIAMTLLTLWLLISLIRAAAQAPQPQSSAGGG